jgi:hypothetical protein
MTTCSVINPSGAGLTTWKVPNFMEFMPDSYSGATATLIASQVYHREPVLSRSFAWFSSVKAVNEDFVLN